MLRDPTPCSADDLLDISLLEQHVAESLVVLLFLTPGYWSSQNCLREVRAAVEQEKPLITVADVEQNGRELQMEYDDCPANLRGQIFGPRSSASLEAGKIILWMRLKAFQIESIRLVATRMLMATRKSTALSQEVNLVAPKEIRRARLYFESSHALYFSSYNVGAQGVADELADVRRAVRPGRSRPP